MLYIRNDSLDPYYNLALEEYAFREIAPRETLVLLWQNSPSVIIGRFQNTVEEINGEYIKEKGINVVRRITGGGAVYHDLGNLNFTFIEPQNSKGIDFRRFTEPVVQALRQLGVNAEHSGRNDITIEGKKFSGNAQYNQGGRTLHHGTILFNSNLDDVQAALNVSGAKIESKGVKSVRSRVTNLSDYLPPDFTLHQFREHLLNHLFAGCPVQEYKLTEKEQQAVETLRREKYLTWEWNYGQSPAFNQVKSGRFACGGIEVRLFVEKGLIQECSIYGDFFSNKELSELIEAIRGTKHERAALEKVLAGQDLKGYFGPITLDELLSLFI